jgi:hypothetical protein
MHRTQILLAPELHRRAATAARARGTSLGGLVREALVDYLGRVAGEASDGTIERELLDEPYDDPAPDSRLSVDVDHYLYGAARRTKRRR